MPSETSPRRSGSLLRTERFGRIDVLVNNAGYGLLSNFEEFTTEQIGRQFAPNLGASHT